MDSTAPFLLVNMLGSDVCKLISSYNSFPCSPDIKSLMINPIKLKKGRHQGRFNLKVLFELHNNRLVRIQKRKMKMADLNSTVRNSFLLKNWEEYLRWSGVMYELKEDRKQELRDVLIKKRVSQSLKPGQVWIDRPHHWWKMKNVARWHESIPLMYKMRFNVQNEVCSTWKSPLEKMQERGFIC